MSSAITNIGQTRIAQSNGGGTPLLIDRMVLAFIPGLDPSIAVDRAQAMPTAEQVVHTANIDKQGYVNPDQVVYSILLGSDLGDWSFNWIGLVETGTDNIIAITTHPGTPKHKTDIQNNTTGNNITRNFMIQFVDAQNITAITVSAETWQYNLSSLLADAVNAHAILIVDPSKTGETPKHVTDKQAKKWEEHADDAHDYIKLNPLVSSFGLANGETALSLDADGQLNITNGIFYYTKGLTGKGYTLSSKTVTKNINATGIADGTYWLSVNEDGTVTWLDSEPNCLFWSELGLAFKEGKWYQDNAILEPCPSFIPKAVNVVGGKIQSIEDETLIVNAMPRTAFPDGIDITGNQMMHVRDERAVGQMGGPADQGMNIRVLNTVVTNTIVGASLNSDNQVTLPAGRFRIRGRAQSYSANRHQGFLYNVNDEQVEIVGSSMFAYRGDNVNNETSIAGRIKNASPKDFEFRHYIETPSGLADLGQQAGNAITDNEVFAELWIERE
ncbi:MAG: phage tail protein [Desulfotalea sp.]